MKFTTEEASVINAVDYLPSVSVILPFEAKISLRAELEHQMKCSLSDVERQLQHDYDEEIYMPVLQRLEQLIKNVDFSTDKKSVLFYVSPIAAKTFYLDVRLGKKIIVNGSFEIRDLVYSKQVIFKFLVLLLSGKHAKLFLGGNSHLVKLISDQEIVYYDKDLPEHVANFSDPGTIKDNELDKFLRRTDTEIDTVIKTYHLPLFVVAPKKVAAHFRQISKHEIEGIVPGNFDEATTQDILIAIAPLVKQWQQKKADAVMLKLGAALKAGKLTTGLRSVWTAAKDKLGKMLVVEKNFSSPAEHTDKEHFIRTRDLSSSEFYIHDAVDDIIEMVLESGGDVTFVEDGTLGEFQHIALIQYY